MAQEITPIKTPPPVVAKNGNGTPGSSRIAPKKSRSGFGWWIWAVAALLLAAGLVYFYLPKQPSGQASGTGTSRHGHGGGAGGKVRVVGAVATKSDIGVYLTGLGSVIPMYTDTIKTRVAGQLMKVLFAEGQTVKEGDLLLQIDSRPYEAQLEQFKAQLEHDQALLDNAKIDLDRYQTLWKQDSIPQQQLATQASLVKQDQGTVDSDQAQIDATQLNITYCNITAPISGRVGLRLVDPGNYVQPSDTTGLLVINQVQPITVTFTIAQDFLPPVLAKLNAGQQLQVDAFDRDGFTKKLAQGTLLTTDNQIDLTTGTLELKALFTNQDNSLFPHQFVNVRLLVEMKHDTTVVPVAAIQHGAQSSTFVYVVDTSTSTRTVKMQKVTVGTIDGDNAEIASGVSPGDTVVTDGVDKLQNGSQVILANDSSGN